MKLKFELKTEKEYTSDEIAALLNETWVCLEELKSTGLEAYGHVSREERKIIEPSVHSLLKRLNEIEEIFNKK